MVADQLRTDADNLRQTENPSPAMLRSIATHLDLAVRVIEPDA